MGPDGQAIVPIQGCQCKACELTNTALADMGCGRADNGPPEWGVSPATRDYRHWERDLAEYNEELAIHLERLETNPEYLQSYQ